MNHRLSPCERRIVRLLEESAPEPVTAERIATEMGYAIFDHAIRCIVSTNISRIRRKLGRDRITIVPRPGELDRRFVAYQFGGLDFDLAVFARLGLKGLKGRAS